MNVTPILMSLGIPLAVLAAIVAVFDPYAAFLYVAASQIAPDAPNFPLTLAQLFIVAWIVTLPFNGCKAGFCAIGPSMGHFAAFILIWTVIGIYDDTLNEVLPYAWITAGSCLPICQECAAIIGA